MVLAWFGWNMHTLGEMDDMHRMTSLRFRLGTFAFVSLMKKIY